jgi:RNA recognition motif-containing protein
MHLSFYCGYANDDILPEIRDDVQAECEKYGKILSLKIPRPVGGSRQSAGAGKIFIKFETPDSAAKALRALAGRKFSDRTVVTTYFPEVSSFGSQTSSHLHESNKYDRKTLMSARGRRYG